MRRGFQVAVLASTGVLTVLCSPVAAQTYSRHDSGVQVDVGIFYDDLAPYGEWIEMPDYGWSWAPRVHPGWRPYTRGQWVMTDDGWFWDSDERFGWATYHYGRWVNDRDYGWFWVPGYEWAPAWVSWRHGNGYTGWAPLPPRATWRTHVGLSIGGLEIDAFIGARDYAFVPDQAFVDRGVYQRVLPSTQNVTIINVTNNVTNYTVLNQRVVNSGIAVANVERAVGRRVPRARTIDVERADAPRRGRRDEVAVFRPQVRDAPERKPGHGRSLVKGEEPTPLLAERRKEREQERQQRGHELEVTAKDVQRQRDQGGQEADKRRANGQEQLRLERENRQANDQEQRDQARHHADKQRAQVREQQLEREKPRADAPEQGDRRPLDQLRAKRERDPQAEPGKPAKDAPQETKDSPRDKGKNNPRDKGKKNPDPSPTPQGQQR